VIINGVEYQGRVYADALDLVGALREAGHNSVADDMLKWRERWIATYGDATRLERLEAVRNG
jgi:hypothetical protein